MVTDMSNIREPLSRSQLLDATFSSSRRVSAMAVLFHQAIADRLCISASDSRYASIVREREAMTAGELAQLSGLTTGAVSGLIDRLEVARLVRRETNPRDRRQVIVAASDERHAEIEELFKGAADRAEQLLVDYSSRDLELIAHFNTEWADIMESEARGLRP